MFRRSIYKTPAQLQAMVEPGLITAAALDAVILLDVPREESIERLQLRAHEQGRADDTVEGIAHRLDIYEKETAPILDVYGERGIVDRIDGVGSLDEITERIFAALAARGLGLAA